MEFKDVLMCVIDGKEIFRLNEINNITCVDDSINPDFTIEPYYSFSKQTEFTADFSADFQRIAHLISPSNNPDFHMEALVDRIQKRKHKKRRINKKWAKRYGYWDVILRGKVNPDVSMEHLEDKDVRWQGTIDDVEVVVR